MTTVGLPDTFTDTARELVSCLIVSSACAYESEVASHEDDLLRGMTSVGCRSMDWERDWDGRPIYYDRQGKPMTMQQWAQRFEDEDSALFALIYAANCEFRYSVRTSWGVR